MFLAAGGVEQIFGGVSGPQRDRFHGPLYTRNSRSPDPNIKIQPDDLSSTHWLRGDLLAVACAVSSYNDGVHT